MNIQHAGQGGGLIPDNADASSAIWRIYTNILCKILCTSKKEFSSTVPLITSRIS